ncbi:MAG TPA: dihydroorotase, partial [Flavobacteriaceae bacterium]|nr:dihydroorotase [Flavobacteriaceae bacterium]
MRNTRTLVIKNATIVNENRIQTLDLLIQGKRILKIDDDIPTALADEVYDAYGKYVLPGLIDDQVHFR